MNLGFGSSSSSTVLELLAILDSEKRDLYILEFHTIYVLTNEQFTGIERIIEKNRNDLGNVRLLMITPTRWLRLYKGEISRSPENLEHELFSNLEEIDRGKILDIFSKIEFLVNEMIQTKVIGYDVDRSYLLDSILENISFSTKLSLLKEWGLFEGYEDRIFYKIKAIMNVRNRLAHQWSPTESEYKKRPLIQVFSDFKKDLKKCWIDLIEIYSKEQDQKLNKYVYEIDKGNYNSFLAG